SRPGAPDPGAYPPHRLGAGPRPCLHRVQGHLPPGAAGPGVGRQLAVGGRARSLRGDPGRQRSGDRAFAGCRPARVRGGVGLWRAHLAERSGAFYTSRKHRARTIMLELFSDPAVWASFLTLTILEIVL